MRESCLRAAANLPDGAFLSLADAVLAEQQNDLVPAAVNMLENLGSDDAIALLKKYQQKVGAPLVRNSCNLALFRLGVEGPYAEALQAWVEEQADIDLIRFRAMVPRELNEQGSSHLLTPEESSRLFLTSVESLAARQDDRGVNVLLTLIRDGNPKNRYALAGLLIRTIQ
jgi:HEAT repeat protein